MLYAIVGLLFCTLVGWVAPGTAGADGAVYAMTNALRNNEIVVYHRAADGVLTEIQRIATGGGGSGVQLDPTDSLGSQSGLVLDRFHQRLFAVNTESFRKDKLGGEDISDCHQGTISSFRVASDGRLRLVDRIPSGGLFPASLTIHENLLYVLNAGGPGLNPECGIDPNITGFRVRPNGELRLFLSTTQPINPGSSPGSFLNCDPGGGPFPTDEFRCGLNPPAFPRGPAQVGFTPDGNALVVTVKGTHSIYVFPVDGEGRPGTPTISQVSHPNAQNQLTQPTPFGFAFSRSGQLIVTEPFGTAPTIPTPLAGAVSSFTITDTGDLEVISPSVPNGRGTSCWIVLDPNQRYAYIGNNASSDISSYRINGDGSLTLLEAIAAPQGEPRDLADISLPNDLAVARDGDSRFLYVLNSGNGTVGAFRINADGSLTSLGAFGGLPVDVGAHGLAAY